MSYDALTGESMVRTSHAVRCEMTASLLDKSLVYVTGKGGVGKTTVAAAIGLGSAARGGQHHDPDKAEPGPIPTCALRRFRADPRYPQRRDGGFLRRPAEQMPG